VSGTVTAIGARVEARQANAGLRAGAEQGRGADCFQRPLVPRSRFQPQLTPSVRSHGDTSVSITRFFTNTLGANLKNARWSWGAEEPMTNRIFLRLWKDQIETLNDGERILVLVARDQSRNTSRGSPGFGERRTHIEKIRNGAEGFGVVCTAADPDTDEARTIVEFDQDTLLRLGAITEENGRTYARIEAWIESSKHFWRAPPELSTARQSAVLHGVR
jgi:hypothetical protein